MRKPSLFAQILAVNSLLIAATVFSASIAANLDMHAVGELRAFMVFVAALMGTVLVNALVLRRRFAPLERLIATMERVDLTEPGRRADVPGADSADVARLVDAFNRMLGRIELERSEAAHAILQAQESERARIARDLHDEVNQALTGLLLRLEAAAAGAPDALRSELRDARAVAAQAMEELLRLARELRPAALDDHGLDAALRTQLDRFRSGTGVAASLDVAGSTAGLTDDEQLVVYRVVQESLSNVARHAHAGSVRVALDRVGSRTIVSIADDGEGFSPAAERAGGLGLAGMRERALLAGGRVDVRSAIGAGTTIELRLGEHR